MRRRGLNFRRRKKKLNLTALQGAAFWIGEVILAFVVGCMVVWFFGYTFHGADPEKRRPGVDQPPGL